MSVISDKVGDAIFAKSNVSGLVGSTDGKLTAIYQDAAEDKAVFPYGVFNRQAPGAVGYTFGGPNLSHEDDLWLLQVFADKTVSQTKSPQRLASQLLNLWESTIDRKHRGLVYAILRHPVAV